MSERRMDKDSHGKGVVEVVDGEIVIHIAYLISELEIKRFFTFRLYRPSLTEY